MNIDHFLILPRRALIFVPDCKISCCEDTVKNFTIVKMHGSQLQEEYRKGTYDASEPQASFFSAADTEATVLSFNPAFLSWICKTICIKNYNGKCKCIELEGITRLQEACTTRTPHLDQLSPCTVTKILSTEAMTAQSLSSAPVPLLAVHPNESKQKNHRRAHTSHQVQGTHPSAFSSSYSCFACKFYMKTNQNAQWNYTALSTAVQYTPARVRKWHFYWPIRIWYATIISKDDD